MKLSILYESRDPKRPTDLMQVAAPAQPGSLIWQRPRAAAMAALRARRHLAP